MKKYNYTKKLRYGSFLWVVYWSVSSYVVLTGKIILGGLLIILVLGIFLQGIFEKLRHIQKTLEANKNKGRKDAN